MMMNTCNQHVVRSDDAAATERVVRPATQAGRFYEANAQRLAHEVDGLLALHARDSQHKRLAALIVPHAGYYYSGNVAASAYAAIPRDAHYKRIFLLGPSHHEWLNGASVNTDADAYATPLGEVRVDMETALKLTQGGHQGAGQTPGDSSVITCQPRAHDREHCLEVQLPFLQRFFALYSSLPDKQVPPIVPVIISTNDFSQLRQIAEALKPYFTDENLFIVSSDFSHYPSYKDACWVDALTGKAVASGDVQQFIATIEGNTRLGIRNLATSACGELAIITLMLMMDSQYEVSHLLYQNSGDIDRTDPSRVVGYHAFAIDRKDAGGFSLTDEEKQALKQVAFNSIKDSLDGKSIAATISSLNSRNNTTAAANSSLNSRETPAAPNSSLNSRENSTAAANSSLFTLHSSLNKLHSSLKQKCGAFVSLHKHGRLRGCIGHFGEDVPLYEIVAEMARAAAFEDPRFTPVSKDELKDIDIEISVLTPMRRIHSLDEFELHRHGIYIRKGYRSGTFLPQVADEVNWTKEEFVSHCAQDKAGSGWDGWKTAELYVYEAIVF